MEVTFLLNTIRKRYLP